MASPVKIELAYSPYQELDMERYKNIKEDILSRAQKREPLSTLPMQQYNLNGTDLRSFLAYAVGTFPESIAVELLIAIKEKLVVFSESDWKDVVSNVSIHKNAANRTLIHFFLFHTDAPVSFIEKIGLDTNSISNDFSNYYNETKKTFYSVLNGKNKSLYEKLQLTGAGLDLLKSIGTMSPE